MLQKLLWILIALLLIGCDRTGQPTAKGSSMQQYEAGQVWTYKTRPGEEASRIVICRVESDPTLGQIVHVHVHGLRLKNKHVDGGLSSTIAHMPYSGDALRNSIQDLESTGTTLPAFEDGYQEWRSAFDQGNAGVWSIPLSEAITAMESALNG